MSYAYSHISTVDHPARIFLLAIIVATCSSSPTRLAEILDQAGLEFETLLVGVIARFRFSGDPQYLCQDNNIVQLANAISFMHREGRISVDQLLSRNPEITYTTMAILQSSAEGVMLLSSLFHSRELNKTPNWDFFRSLNVCITSNRRPDFMVRYIITPAVQARFWTAVSQEWKVCKYQGFMVRLLSHFDKQTGVAVPANVIEQIGSTLDMYQVWSSSTTSMSWFLETFYGGLENYFNTTMQLFYGRVVKKRSGEYAVRMNYHILKQLLVLWWLMASRNVQLTQVYHNAVCYVVNVMQDDLLKRISQLVLLQVC